MKKRVLAAMSGGVDSSAAAAILGKRGFDVCGVFLNLGQVNYGDALKSAKKVAEKIGISLKIIDLRKQFKKEIIDYFFWGYKEGITPNPCVKCNKDIKFGLLLKLARKMKFDYLATGHYVRLQRKSQTPRTKFQTNSKFKIQIAKDKTKDQSYFLYNLSQKQLGKLLFPLGNYTKEEVRKMADKWHLPYLKKESQDICFLDCEHNKYLKKYLKLKKGKIATADGKIIGEHYGLPLYTIGQRHGFSKGGGVPYYVVDKNIKKNLLIVASKADEPKFYKKEVEIKNVRWISPKQSLRDSVAQADKAPVGGVGKCLDARCPRGHRASFKARIRYRQPLQICKVRVTRNAYRVIFTKSQRAVTPGQSLVIYDGQTLLGGGIIK